MKSDEHIRMQHYISIQRPYFDEVFLPAFITMQKNIPCTEKKIIIAGKNLLLKFYTPYLVDFMMGSLLHHPSFTDEPVDYTIHLFDTVTTHTDLIAPWKNHNHYYPLGTDTQTHEIESFKGVYWYDETLNLHDPKNKQAFFWTHDAQLLPSWVGASPLRGILHWILSEYAIQLVHGAVVGYDNKSVLLSAKSGSGKSTTALACLLGGLNYLADDYSALELQTSITAHNLYNSIKVLPDGFTRFPELHNYPIWNKTTFDNGTDSKAFIFMNNTDYSMQLSAPLSAILIPKITGGITKIIPTTKMQAMLALIPSTLFQLPLPGSSTVDDLKKIINTLPCYTIELGPDVRQSSDVIKKFLQEL